MPQNSPGLRRYLMLLWPLLLIGGVLILRQQFTAKNVGAGYTLYLLHCANCHGDQGEGLRKLIPPLANNPDLVEKGINLVCIIRNGQRGRIVYRGVNYDFPMPGNPLMTAREISIVVNFLRSSWGNDAPLFSFEEIEEGLRQCENRDP